MPICGRSVVVKSIDLIQESFIADAETAGGLPSVPLGFDEHLENRSALGLPCGFVADFEQGRSWTSRGLGVWRGRGSPCSLCGRLRDAKGNLPHDLGYVTDDYVTLANIFKLADIAGPRILHKRLRRGGVEVINGSGIERGILLDEVVNKYGNLIAAFAQGWDMHGNNVDAIEEVFAEKACGDPLFKGFVGGADDAHVDGGISF